MGAGWRWRARSPCRIRGRRGRFPATVQQAAQLASKEVQGEDLVAGGELGQMAGAAPVDQGLAQYAAEAGGLVQVLVLGGQLLGGDLVLGAQDEFAGGRQGRRRYARDDGVGVAGLVQVGLGEGLFQPAGGLR